MNRHNTRWIPPGVSAVPVCISSTVAACVARRPTRSWTFALALMALIAACLLIAPGVSFAGTGGTEFNGAYTTITSWLQGDLGRLIAAALLVVGLVMGVVRQSIMAAVPAIACGLVATVAPTIIGAVVTAVI